MPASRAARWPPRWRPASCPAAGWPGTPGWSGEGVDGYILSTQAASTLPLYRLYFPGGGEHHWTTDASESQVLVQKYGWLAEGLAGYLLP